MSESRGFVMGIVIFVVLVVGGFWFFAQKETTQDQPLRLANNLQLICTIKP